MGTQTVNSQQHPTAAHHPEDTTILAEVRAHLDGRSRQHLESLAHQLWTGTNNHRAATLHAVTQALIELRRTGQLRYRAQRHHRRARAEDLTLNAHLAAQVLHSALKIGEPVLILGEHHHGTIINRLVTHDIAEEYPTTWYVVAVDALRRCRAHGTDEIEPLTTDTTARNDGRRRHHTTARLVNTPLSHRNSDQPTNDFVSLRRSVLDGPAAG